MKFSTAMIAGLAVAAIAIAGSVNARALRDAAPEAGADDQRATLPSAVTPDHYRVEVTPDAQTKTFTGEVQIDIVVHQATDAIVLNTADIIIDKAALSGEPARPAVRYDEQQQTATFAFDHPLKPGPYLLSLQYHGKIYDQASGLFALDYQGAAGKSRALFTQFENSDARRFIPSWDEPARKATFELTVIVPADQMALSNMPVSATQALPGGLKKVRFAVTPKMSSYLLFFGLGDFERVHRTVGGVDIGVVVKRGDGPSARYALDAAADLLPYYDDYFAKPYPLPKLDLIAGPGTSQFFGAMENWGAIFYFERDLLIDPRVSTQGDQQNVYITVAHEMAHQWFGDLVTMAWWDDLWLNEGFASWMEDKATDHFHPEWNVWLQSLGSKQGAMQVDAKDGTHPVITPIGDVFQASGAFDTITYSKGEAVIRTLESYVGPDAWRAGVRRYIADHAYANTTTEDLWRAMDVGASRPITKMAHDFTLQAGVPMIEEPASVCREGRTRMMLTQNRFTIDPGSTSATVWRVPVIAQSLTGEPAEAVITGPQPTPLDVAGCGPVIINAGQTAYFRTRYAPDMLDKITTSFKALKPDDQLGVLNDASTLAYGGLEPMAALMDLTKSVPVGAHPIVSKALAERLGDLDALYRDLPSQPAFRRYARGVLDPMLSIIGWESPPGESENIALFRSSLLSTLGGLDDPGVLADAQAQFTRFRANPASVSVASRNVILRIVAAHADDATWDQLHVMAKAAQSQLERQEFYALLCSAKDDRLAQKALDLSLSGEPPVTSVPGMIRVVALHHTELAFAFASAHWDQISPLLEPSYRSGYMPALIGASSNLKMIPLLDAFADGHIAANDRKDVKRSEATVRYQAKVRQTRLPEIDQWLKTHGE